jgi:hypothetical protein
MYCPECGKQVVDRAKFCPHCGIQLAPLEVVEVPTHGVIRLTRNYAFGASVQDFPVSIDGRRVGSITNDSTQQYKVSPGKHTVSVSVFMGGTREITVSVERGQQVNLRCWVELLGGLKLVRG